MYEESLISTRTRAADRYGGANLVEISAGNALVDSTAPVAALVWQQD